MKPTLRFTPAFELSLGQWSWSVLLLDLMVIGVCSVMFGLLFRYPGSIPPGWHRVDGSVSSVIGKANHGSTQYYPVVQYLALGYSHDVTSKRGYSYYPALGTPFKVAFDPAEPEDAKLVSDSSPNYFAVLPWLGLAAVATAAFKYLRALQRYHLNEAERMISKPAVVTPAPVMKEAKPAAKPKKKPAKKAAAKKKALKKSS